MRVKKFKCLNRMFLLVILILFQNCNKKETHSETVSFTDSLAFRTNSNEAKEYFEVAMFHMKEKEFQLAIKYFKLSLEYSPNECLTLLNLGGAYKKIGDFNNSEDCYITIIKINSEYIPVYINYSDLLMKKMEFNESIKTANEGLIRTSDSLYISNLSFNLAAAYINIDSCAKANECFIRSINFQRGVLSEADKQFQDYLGDRCPS